MEILALKSLIIEFLKLLEGLNGIFKQEEERNNELEDRLIEVM